VYNHASTGLYLEKLFDLLGIAEQLKTKTVRYMNSAQVLEHVIGGKGIEIGFGTITEIRQFEPKGLKLVGPLPEQVQNSTAYSAAVITEAPEGEARGISCVTSLHRPQRRFFPPPESSRGSPMASLLDKVDVHDAGDKLILSSHDEAILKYVIEEMRKEGAQGVQMPVKVGGKWVASFEHPALSQCTVERLGFEIIIADPLKKVSSPDPANSRSGSPDRPRAREGRRRLEALPR